MVLIEETEQRDPNVTSSTGNNCIEYYSVPVLKTIAIIMFELPSDQHQLVL